VRSRIVIEADVIEFPFSRTFLGRRMPAPIEVWTCLCGGQHYILRANGLVICEECRHVQTRLSVVDNHAPAVPPSAA
jgi:hypothetical protein